MARPAEELALITQTIGESQEDMDVGRVVAREALMEVVGLPPGVPDLLLGRFTLEEPDDIDRHVGQLGTHGGVVARFAAIHPILLEEECLQLATVFGLQVRQLAGEGQSIERP